MQIAYFFSEMQRFISHLLNNPWYPKKAFNTSCSIFHERFLFIQGRFSEILFVPLTGVQY